jgi:putative transposase
MGRSRYKVYEPTAPHFVTCTILHWIPIFTRPETVDIVFESLNYLMQTANMRIHAYVILENHLHLVARSGDIDKDMARFKSYTARKIIDHLQARKVTTILDQLGFCKKAHKVGKEFQLWQEGIAPKQILSDAMMRERIEYVHNNPVKRGYVDSASHWRYSSARDYEGAPGLLSVDPVW